MAIQPSEETIEQIAVLHNGGTWPTHYAEQHKEHWRKQARKIYGIVAADMWRQINASGE